MTFRIEFPCSLLLITNATLNVQRTWIDMFKCGGIKKRLHLYLSFTLSLLPNNGSYVVAVGVSIIIMNFLANKLFFRKYLITDQNLMILIWLTIFTKHYMQTTTSVTKPWTKCVNKYFFGICMDTWQKINLAWKFASHL